jgi:hypothetical protein
MARSGQPPTPTGHFPQPSTVNGKLHPATIGGPDLYFFDEDSEIVVGARLRAPIDPPVPRPRVDTIDRFGTVGLTRWSGRDPYELTAPIQFDDFPDGNVEPRINDLSRLTLPRHGRDTPSRVGLVGPVPFSPGMADPPLWYITTIDELDDPVRRLWNAHGHRCRWAADVTLIEAVEDTVLAASTRKGKGVHTKRRRIHKGESLHEFAKRVTGKRSNATDIAHANSLPVSYVAKTAHELRVP